MSLQTKTYPQQDTSPLPSKRYHPLPITRSADLSSRSHHQSWSHRARRLLFLPRLSGALVPPWISLPPQPPPLLRSQLRLPIRRTDLVWPSIRMIRRHSTRCPQRMMRSMDGRSPRSVGLLPRRGLPRSRSGTISSLLSVVRMIPPLQRGHSRRSFRRSLMRFSKSAVLTERWANALRMRLPLSIHRWHRTLPAATL